MVLVPGAQVEEKKAATLSASACTPSLLSTRGICDHCNGLWRLGEVVVEGKKAARL